MTPTETATHTPEPWEVHEGEVTGADGEVFVAQIVERGRPCAPEDPNEIEANARLIAAAPDLLAALKASQEELLLPSDSALKLQIETAIAKAEGR